MKFNTQRNEIESGGMNIEVDFTIDMNAKAFDVLSDQMYSEVIPTVVRELSSNARDAQLEAGKGDIQFEVGSPTGFDPYFTVKDFGTGLRYFKYNAKIRNDANEDIEGAVTSTIFIEGDVRKDIEGITLLILDGVKSLNISTNSVLYDRSSDQTCIRLNGEFYANDVTIEFDDTLVLYTTYFRSTKEKTNDYIGGYGLGSKTPFAYTDNFTVANRYDGIVRTYSIYKNQDGKPCINLMATESTDECNGLEVRIAVDPNDYITFKEAIENQLKFFVPQPKVLNDVVVMPNIIYQGTHFLLMDVDKHDAGRWNSKAASSVGFNSYEVKYVESKLFNHKLALRFDIGEVMVTASREDLKYDETTIAIIRKREQQAIEEYTAYVIDTIDVSSMTDYQRANYLNQHNEVLDLSTKAVRELVGNSHYKYTKKNISIPITGWGNHSSVQFDPSTDDNGNVVINMNKFGCRTVRGLDLAEYRSNFGKFIVARDDSVDPVDSVYFFVKDNSYSYLKKLNYWLAENGLSLRDSNVWIINNHEDDALDMLKNILAHNGTFVTISEIELPKTISTTPLVYGQTPTARMFEKGKHYFDSPKYWTGVYTPLTKIDRDAYIVETHNGNTMDDDYRHIQFVSRYLRTDLPYDPDTVILMLGKARYAKALGYGFKPLSSLVGDLMETLEIPQTLINSPVLINLYHEHLTDVGVAGLLTNAKPEQLANISKTSTVGKVLRLTKLIKQRYITNKANNNEAYSELISYLYAADKPKPSDFVKEIVDTATVMCDTIDQSLVLLEDMRNYEMRTDKKIDALIDYINFKTQEIEK
jgi:hypothetical protein